MTRRSANPNAPFTPPTPVAVEEGTSAGAATAVDQRVQEGMQRVQQQFKALLQGDSSLGAEQRDEMARVFEQALEDASVSSAPLSEDVFDRATWTETVDMIRRSGGIDSDEVDHLIRSLNDALAPLERRESRLAIEFSRRMAAEGEQQAIEWLRGKQKETDAAQAAREPQLAPQGDYPPLRNEVVNSRSHRLRGPPK